MNLEDDYKDFLIELNSLGGYFRRKLTEEDLNFHWDELKGWHINTIKHAFRELKLACEFFPKIVIIITYCSKALRDHPPNVLLAPRKFTKQEKKLSDLTSTYVAHLCRTHQFEKMKNLNFKERDNYLIDEKIVTKKELEFLKANK